MALYALLFLFVVFLLSLALLWRLGWLHLQTSSSRGGAIHSTVQRLLKPRTPDECPACRLASTPSSSGGPVPAPVRPWSEVKCRRGACAGYLRYPSARIACENSSCCLLLLADSSEEEYKLKHDSFIFT
jgi:hypothetical protein